MQTTPEDRPEQDSNSLQPEAVDINSTASAHKPELIEGQPEGASIYPPKPVVEEEKRSVMKSFYSILAFGVAFYFLFGLDLTATIILVVVIFVHELGHYIAMRSFNYKDLSIFFIPLVGAIASGEKEETDQKQQLVITLAGPLPGIFIGSVLIYFGFLTEDDLVYRSGTIFLFLNLFNMLPVLPMDGGRVIETLFFQQKGVISIILMFISCGLFISFGIYSGDWILFFVAFMILLQTIAKMRSVKVRGILKRQGFQVDKNYSDLTDEEYWKIRDVMASKMQMVAKVARPHDHTVVPEEKSIIMLMKGIVQKPPINNLGFWGKLLFFSIWLFSFTIPVVVIILLKFLGAGA